MRERPTKRNGNDYSDIPPLSSKFWSNAVRNVRNPIYKPTKTSTTVRIDFPVLVACASEGYQSRINAILRREMLASLK
jgi:uncharacterized protein (DUF4415 family)